MADQTGQPSRHDVEAKIVKHCWEDDAFRKEFVADPAAAFTKYLGVPKAQVPKIVIHDEGPGTWHIVLPAKPVNAAELSDAELEQVAGGATPAALIVSAIVISLKFAIPASAAASVMASAGVTVAKGW